MIYLVIAAAVILGEPTLIPPDDCVRVKHIELVKTLPKHRITQVSHKRLLKVEPKPVEEENCDSPTPTVTTFFPPAEEPPDGYTPVPEVALGPLPTEPVPVPELQSVAPLECDCFARVPVFGLPQVVIASGPFYATPAVPEPVTSYLLLAGLGALGFIRSRRT